METLLATYPGRIWLPADRPRLEDGIPLYLSRAVCGFPSPAEDYVERPLDLHEFLVHNRHATFFVRASGTSMIGAGIHDGDLLIVDRALEAVDGSIVVAAVDGDLTVKRLVIGHKRNRKQIILAPENPDYEAIEITDPDSLRIWGVVVHAIHSLTR